MNIKNKNKLDNKLSSTRERLKEETSPPSSTVKSSNVAYGIFSQLPSYAVINHVKDILEHHDTVQVSEKTREIMTIFTLWLN